MIYHEANLSENEARYYEAEAKKFGLEAISKNSPTQHRHSDSYPT